MSASPAESTVGAAGPSRHPAAPRATGPGGES